MTHSPDALQIHGASCLVYRDAPSWGGRKTASVGGFRCDGAPQGEALLARTEAMLRTEGFEAIIGPMDGDTWHSYRLIAESDGSAPFLMEPVSGPYDRAAFEASGFIPISSYVSTRAPLDEAIGTAAKIDANGVEVTPWDGHDAHLLVSAMFDMSGASFSKNAFFKPIAKPEFLKLYEPILKFVDPRLVLFARDQSGLVGFLFGLPNLLESSGAKTAILKTYASARRGVGHLLADRFHRMARDLGFRSVIHALMHADNISLDRSRQHAGRIFRRYALLGKTLS